MKAGSQIRRPLLALMAGLATLYAVGAGAQVSVTTSGNQAFATISLPGGDGSVDADVTITFDGAVNLSAAELNLSATIIDPNDTALLVRLGCGPAPPCPLSVDPAFPLLITVEPLDVPWLYRSGFEADESNGNLAFFNSYEFEIHTAELDCAAPAVGQPCVGTPYRLFKGPIAGSFLDITSEVLKGSVRARGRGGAFSQFLIVADTRPTLIVEQDKAFNLESRILAATLDEGLRTDLLGLLAAVQVAVLQDQEYATAIADLDQLTAMIQLDAGTGIPNRWSSDHSVVNDAGEMEALARTLRYTLLQLQNEA